MYVYVYVRVWVGGWVGVGVYTYMHVYQYTLTHIVPLDPKRVEANRNFANKLWNSARFILSNLQVRVHVLRLLLLMFSSFGTRLTSSSCPTCSYEYSY